MPYTVEAFDLFDAPDERCYGNAGEFATAEAALAAARAVVEASIQRAGPGSGTATGRYRNYTCHGDGVFVHGEPKVEFNCYHYAKARIEELTGEKAKDWLER